MLIAVTGATGFIGKHICQALTAEGHEVRGLVRNPANAASLPAGVLPVTGNLSRADSLQPLVAGTDAVVHCAGNVRGVTQADFDAVNVAGLVNLIAAIKAHAPASRFLSFSSLAAREPHLSFYATSKRRGEDLLEAEPTLQWTILRPPAVYGPGDREMLPLFKLMQRGYALIPGDLNARFSLIYIDDLVASVQLWLSATNAEHRIYTLEDGRPGGHDWPGVMAQFTAMSGRPVRALRPPRRLLNLVAWSNRELARLLGYAPMLTPEKLRELRHPDWVTDSLDIGRAFGWAAQISLQEGLRRTLMASAGVGKSAP